MTSCVGIGIGDKKDRDKKGHVGATLGLPIVVACLKESSLAVLQSNSL